MTFQHVDYSCSRAIDKVLNLKFDIVIRIGEHSRSIHTSANLAMATGIHGLHWGQVCQPVACLLFCIC